MGRVIASASMSLDAAALGDPVVCVQGDRVTHLEFPVTDLSSRGRG